MAILVQCIISMLQFYSFFVSIVCMKNASNEWSTMECFMWHAFAELCWVQRKTWSIEIFLANIRTFGKRFPRWCNMKINLSVDSHFSIEPFREDEAEKIKIQKTLKYSTVFHSVEMIIIFITATEIHIENGSNMRFYMQNTSINV